MSKKIFNYLSISILLLLFIFEAAFLFPKGLATQFPILQTSHIIKDHVKIRFLSKSWELLGPFPTGTREQDFGADPLEAYGGFRNLSFSDTQSFPSELADNGTVKWSTIVENIDGSIGPLHFKNLRWKFNRDPFGWAINQFQMWARGYFELLNSDFKDELNLIPVLVQCQNIGDFYVDDRRLFGDVYGYKNSWHVLYLRSGMHVINVRLVNEIRIFGGQVPSNIRFQCFVRKLELHQIGAMVLDNTIIVPDLVDGFLAGNFASVAILNTQEKSWITVSKVNVINSNVNMTASLVSGNSKTGIRIAPSQQRNIKIYLSIESQIFSGMPLSFQLQFLVSSRTEDKIIYWTKVTNVISINNKNFGDAYKFTFEDFDTTVQYGRCFAMAIPSSEPCKPYKCPILVALHGAGVEADSEFWITAYKRQKSAWILLPTGRTPWGYDWHGPSLKNTQTAIITLSKFMPGVPKHLKPFFLPDSDRLFISGHSNGGQGAWFFMSHFPDSVIAGNPAAAYTKIQKYVPYYWNSEAHLDPILKGILESSIAEYNNDLYTTNLASTVGIPILARAGSDDDNVPPLHSRMLVRLVSEHSGDPQAIKLSEIPGQGHWFDKVMDDDVMQEFYDEHLKFNYLNNSDSCPKEFTIILLNPASFGSKCGIHIEQLQIPFRLGKLHVRIEKYPHGRTAWHIKTSNIRRFKFVNSIKVQAEYLNAERIIIDGKPFDFSHNGKKFDFSHDGKQLDISRVLLFGHFKQYKNKWKFCKFCNDHLWCKKEKHSATYGPAIAILESIQPLKIIIGTIKKDNIDKFLEVAQEIAHSWYLYGRGDAEIFMDSEFITKGNKLVDNIKGNLVLLGGSYENYVTRFLLKSRFNEVKFNRYGSFSLKHKTFSDSGCAGTDHKGLDQVTKLFPKRTGVPIPDWIIVGPESAWKGAGGLLGAGFWDNKWKFNDAIGYLV
ncbi:1077_t:CDS:10 [Cetraspora pellucida]|uniref:1077_t:CDS:1 n=1 Tax=Cetraspora pellucida TaxID=1433469 RepID=A0A9N9FX51_9GLOM|nr:1077_t:CDS:10 [Cetraspora pellucida]